MERVNAMGHKNADYTQHAGSIETSATSGSSAYNNLYTTVKRSSGGNTSSAILFTLLGFGVTTM